jgi:hypothetical protein
MRRWNVTHETKRDVIVAMFLVDKCHVYFHGPSPQLALHKIRRNVTHDMPHDVAGMVPISDIHAISAMGKTS